MTAKIVPHGSWSSPITSDLIVSHTVGLGSIKLDGPDVYWLEGRATEGGRNAVVRMSAGGSVTDVLPRPFNARTRVHEYGGGAYTVDDGVLYFCHFDDQHVHRLDLSGESANGSPAGEQEGADTRSPGPRRITRTPSCRYADLTVDRSRSRLLAVREDHRPTDREAVNEIVALDLDGREPERVLVAGKDFYSSPRPSPDGRWLAWLTWNHPDMPWDGTELWLGCLGTDGDVEEAARIAGSREESIFQPEFAPDGRLYFVSDRTGWWNLHRRELDGTVRPVCERAAEFGRPLWQFGMSTYGFLSSRSIVASWISGGRGHLGRIDVESGDLTPIECPFTEFGSIRVRPAAPEAEGARPAARTPSPSPVVASRGDAASPLVVLLAASPSRATCVVALDVNTGGHEVLRSSTEVTVDPAYLSAPEAIEFLSGEGRTAHGFFYAPRNADHAGPPREKPPLLVMSHGGPTGATSSGLDLHIQYWTSRGIAVLDVNYSGSAGYGRAYRRRLHGHWGLMDVEDCSRGALHLAARGNVDVDRLAITGGSAGGYTTLCALTFGEVFKAGASHYGVSDLEALARDTHKFESRYLDHLIGPYPAMRDVYRERSPIHHADRLSCPMIFFQGLEDRIVPPDQAELMVEVLRRKGVPVAYITFEGEQHGFRRKENVKRALDAELSFYGRVFGFDPAGAIEPVPIENADRLRSGRTGTVPAVPAGGGDR